MYELDKKENVCYYFIIYDMIDILQKISRELKILINVEECYCECSLYNTIPYCIIYFFFCQFLSAGLQEYLKKKIDITDHKTPLDENHFVDLSEFFSNETENQSKKEIISSPICEQSSSNECDGNQAFDSAAQDHMAFDPAAQNHIAFDPAAQDHISQLSGNVSGLQSDNEYTYNGE